MNSQWLSSLLVLAMAVSAVAQPTTAPGMRLDDEAYEQLPYQSVLLKEKLPVRISYESLCPVVQAQGTYSTCVGFACGYYFRTIIEAQARRITDKIAIDQLAFSPGYLYEKAKDDGDYACTQGVYLSRALEVLRGTGAVPVKRFPYPACNQKTDALSVVAAQYRIGAYERLFSVYDKEQTKIDNLRRALAGGNPVVIGMVVPASFYTAGRVWKPDRREDPQDKQLQGHALCLIGYDDRWQGGSFRVVNSFGSAWADKGFCWIRYQDLARFTRYGYTLSQL
jgi:Papain family cysteine protease